MTDKEALRRFKAVCKMCDAVSCDECKGKNAIDALEWHKGQPSKNGKYLVKKKLMSSNIYIAVLLWSNDLYKTDNYNFKNYKNKCGWYDYDRAYGYCKINNEDIVEWKEII